jgi:periplasmic copper chaperone A
MLRKLVAGLVALLAVTSGAWAQSPAKPGIVVDKVWARATPGNAQTGAAYLSITNTGTAPDRLLSVSSTVAEKAELHENKTENGIMKMRPKAPVAFKPGETVTLKPGGDHLMLMGLKQPLKEGDSITLTLIFEKAGAVQVTARVAKVGAMGAGEMGHGGMGDMGNGAMPHGNH